MALAGMGDIMNTQSVPGGARIISTLVRPRAKHGMRAPRREGVGSKIFRTFVATQALDVA